MSLPKADIRLRSVEDLGYHNRYLAHRALRMVAELPEGLQPRPQEEKRRLLEVLGKLVPEVVQARLRAGTRKGFLESRLEGPAELSWAAGCLAVLLQKEFYPTASDFAPLAMKAGFLGFAFEFKDIEHGRYCGRTALRLIELLSFQKGESLLDAEVALHCLIAEFRVATPDLALNHNLREILERAEARGIPANRIPGSDRYVEFGQGCKRHRFTGVVSDLESRLALEMQHSKLFGHRLLSASGLPAPRALSVRSGGEAAAAARGIGFPVVLKPDCLGMGIGVYVGLTSEAEVREAYAKAAKLRAPIIVESFIPGDDHRMLVVDGKLIAVAKRIPAQVVGDGQRSIEQLIRDTNRDPRRKRRYTTIMYEITIDEESRRLLKQAGLSLHSIPGKGEAVLLKRTANISSGGSAVDLTEQTHPDNLRMAERVARVMGMGVVGIDFITTDIAHSHFEVGGAICEINATIGLGPHRAADIRRDVTSPILARTFPPGEDGRIPTAAVTGTTGKTTTARMLAAILAGSGLQVGCATTDGVTLGGAVLAEGDLAGRSGAEMIFANPLAEAAVLETARGGIITRGLAFDRCDAAAITNVGPDHLGEYGIDSVEQMAEIKGRVLRAARKAVAINADDPLVFAQRARCAAERTILFAARGRGAAIEAHVAEGGEALVLERREGKTALLLLRPGGEVHLADAEDLPATFAGRAMHNAENALCAAALATGMDLDPEVIRRGLAGFKPDMENSPGRLSFIDGLPFGLLIDFAHNPAQLGVLTAFLKHYEAQGRRICLMTVGGNRAEEHIAACGRSVAGAFDRYVCYEREDLLRGRPRGEIAGLLRQGMIEGGVPAAAIDAGLDIWAAVDRSVELAAPGDLVVILATAWPSLVPAFQAAAAARFADWRPGAASASGRDRSQRGTASAP